MYVHIVEIIKELVEADVIQQNVLTVVQHIVVNVHLIHVLVIVMVDVAIDIAREKLGVLFVKTILVTTVIMTQNVMNHIVEDQCAQYVETITVEADMIMNGKQA